MQDEELTVYHYSKTNLIVINLPERPPYYLTRAEAETLRWQLSINYAEIQRNNEFPDESTEVG